MFSHHPGMGVKPSSPTRGKPNLGLPVPPDAAALRLHGGGAHMFQRVLCRVVFVGFALRKAYRPEDS